MAPQARRACGADALDRLGIETRRGEREPQQIEASARFSESVRSEPRNVSRAALKARLIARASSRSWNARASSSPAPSSSSAAAKLATPGLVRGPARRRRRRRIPATASAACHRARARLRCRPASRSAGSWCAEASGAAETRASGHGEDQRADHERFSVGPGLDEMTGHRAAQVEPVLGRLRTSSAVTARMWSGQALTLSTLSPRSARTVDARERAWLSCAVDRIGDEPGLRAPSRPR